MDTTPAFSGLTCTDCGERVDPDEPGRCPDCGAPLDPTYEYDEATLDDSAFETPRPASMWAFDDRLPFPAAVAVSAGEGGTPLVEASGLAADLGVGRVLLKDEGRNPTGTVYDRGMALATTAAVAHGADLVALASPGDGAQSAAAYAGRADLRSVAFVPSRAPFQNKAMINVHGGDMRVVGGRFPDAEAALRSDLQREWYSLEAFTTPYRHEGAKTVAYELAAALDAVPDAVVVPVGTGEVLVGVEKGFRELERAGVLDAVPRLVAAQSSGCAPVVDAWREGLDAPDAWETPDTICGELEIPDPAGGRLALDALSRTGGDAVAVDDPDLLESAVVAAQRDAVEVSPAGGAAAAAAWELADDFDADDTVVVLDPAAGGKSADVLRSHLMGQGV